MLIRDVMTKLAITLDPATAIASALHLMDDAKISRSDVIHLLAARDRRVQAEVTELLQPEEPDWQVQQDGIVTITGPADPRERHLAEVLTGTVRGVIGVQINRLSADG